ncbi:MAG: hypothetical protein CSYNP_02817 [Syntrophus sp. SKADARSKE-3]|nr:hypothetical protein [Syntrophus sp. SKADARSKE-3]
MKKIRLKEPAIRTLWFFLFLVVIIIVAIFVSRYNTKPNPAEYNLHEVKKEISKTQDTPAVTHAPSVQPKSPGRFTGFIKDLWGGHIFGTNKSGVSKSQEKSSEVTYMIKDVPTAIQDQPSQAQAYPSVPRKERPGAYYDDVKPVEREELR